jgi:hypothetical protein
MGVPEMWSTSKMTMYMGLMDDKPLGLGVPNFQRNFSNPSFALGSV